MILWVLLGMFLLLVVLHWIVLRDLRKLERDYVAAREPTACANQSLLPLAFDNERIGEVDAVVLDEVRKASRDSVALRRRFEKRQVVPFPPLRSARAAIEDALVAQDALYRAMLDDPDNSLDELRALGRNNNRAERKLGRVRSMLLASVTNDWNRRFICDEEPPEVRQ